MPSQEYCQTVYSSYQAVPYRCRGESRQDRRVLSGISQLSIQPHRRPDSYHLTENPQTNGSQYPYSSTNHDQRDYFGTHDSIPNGRQDYERDPEGQANGPAGASGPRTHKQDYGRTVSRPLLTMSNGQTDEEKEVRFITERQSAELSTQNQNTLRIEKEVEQLNEAMKDMQERVDQLNTASDAIKSFDAQVIKDDSMREDLRKMNETHAERISQVEETLKTMKEQFDSFDENLKEVQQSLKQPDGRSEKTAQDATINKKFQDLVQQVESMKQELSLTAKQCTQMKEDMTEKEAEWKKLSSDGERGKQEALESEKKAQQHLQESIEKYEKTKEALEEVQARRNSIDKIYTELKQIKSSKPSPIEDPPRPVPTPGPTPGPTTTRSPVERVWIVPEQLYNDERVTAVLEQAVRSVDTSIRISALPSSSINLLTHNGRVLLPVVAASRVGSDLEAAMDRAKLGNVAAIVLIFHNLAPHNCKIYASTKSRLSDRTLVERNQAMLDLVFWDGSMYECEANTKAIKELRDIVKTVF